MKEPSKPKLFLKPGREKSVLMHHPWIFSGAVDRVELEPEPGATVEVFSSKGEWICRAAYSPKSNIRARIWTWQEEEKIDLDFFVRRVHIAMQVRSDHQLDQKGDMYRVVNAESDGIPGLVVDRYGSVIVMQILSAGCEYWREIITTVLKDLPEVECVYERSDVDVRILEGLPQRTGVQAGTLPQQPMQLSENYLNFFVDVSQGHKTGFYLDQRENRWTFKKMVSGMQVLNCFCYTGGFSVHAFSGGAASVTSVDSSREALMLCERNLALNEFQSLPHESVEGDVFQVLRKFRDQNRQYDAIVLDPPKFAPTASQAERAARGYKDINLLAMKLLRRGGLLFTFSCSGGVSMDLFQKIVASAAQDAGLDVLILQRLFQGKDHPVRLNFPEGTYLKGLVCKVL